MREDSSNYCSKALNLRKNFRLLLTEPIYVVYATFLIAAKKKNKIYVYMYFFLTFNFLFIHLATAF